MTASIMDGTAVARRVREEVTAGVNLLVASGQQSPGLATVLIGDDPASEMYVRSKRRSCVAVGLLDQHQHLPADVSQGEAEALLDKLAADPAVSGILVQLPAPRHLDTQALLARIPPEKDVDGLTTVSAGMLAQGQAPLKPCTPSGIITMLDYYQVALAGQHAVVVGRSALVGQPMARLLTGRDATVTVCHSRTRDLVGECQRADVLVVAAGVPGLLGGDAVKPGATVIDVGIHRDENGLRGDVDFASAAAVAGRITPVPGGVGPMTIAMLLANTLTAATLQTAR